MERGRTLKQGKVFHPSSSETMIIDVLEKNE
jgi:hypothetical protein